jgi:CheY-like chemotaxis protein
MRTVLVVDDEFGVAEVLQSILEDEGYRVITAINGKQALTRLAETAPDLAMVDYMMPIMNGAHLLAAMHKEQDWTHIPVIMMSSLDEVTVRSGCERFNAFLRKPFRANAVVALVERVLNSAPDSV